MGIMEPVLPNHSRHQSNTRRPDRSLEVGCPVYRLPFTYCADTRITNRPHTRNGAAHQLQPRKPTRSHLAAVPATRYSARRFSARGLPRAKVFRGGIPPREDASARGSPARKPHARKSPARMFRTSRDDPRPNILRCGNILARDPRRLPLAKILRAKVPQAGIFPRGTSPRGIFPWESSHADIFRAGIAPREDYSARGFPRV